MEGSKNIIFLTDYKNRFESKFNDTPYRNGMDHDQISKLLLDKGYHALFINAQNIEAIEELDSSTPVITTSIEENESNYKSFLLDITEHLHDLGYKIIPKIEFLKAHENKVFMELLRKRIQVDGISDLKTAVFGNIEDFSHILSENQLNFPFIIKGANGAKSKNVYLVHNMNEALRTAALISQRKSFKSRMKDLLRSKRHNNYTPESQTRHKFLAQEFITDLKNDWKILIFSDKLFVLNRGIKSNSFKASGQGIDYKSGSQSGFPEKKLNTVYSFYKTLNTPYASIDVAIKNDKLYVFEFQCVLFGKSTILMSDDYYKLSDDQWTVKKNNFSQEFLICEAIVDFLNKKSADT